MKIWTTDRSNNVHTQRTPLQYRATLHRTTRITLASLLFGRYACLLCFLRPLISRKGLLATSWRRSFGLLLCGGELRDVEEDFSEYVRFWKALAEIYKMHSFAPFWNRIPTTRKTVGHRSRGIRLGEEIYENKH